jgi:enoyl-CoA hydratase/carnithine racemase
MTGAPEKPAAGIARRDLLALAGTAAAAMAGAGASFAQTAPASGASPSDRTPTVVIERRSGGLLLIGIDRPETQNRIDIPTFNSLGQAYYEFERDDDLRVAVLYGKGPDFSRGLDLASWGAALAAGPFRPPPRFLDPLATIGPQRSKPVVVAVQGQVTRVAHELFLAADVRVAARDAIFNQGEVTSATFPGGGATVRFTREAGWGNAMRYMLTGDDWHAEEAFRMGLVQELTAPGQQLDRALALAQRIAAAAPLGVRALLASAHRALADGEKLALATLQPEFGRLFGTADRQEYVRSLQERRAPVFVGR